MEASFCRLDIVGVGSDVFLVAVGVLDCYFRFSAFLAHFEVYYVLMNQILCPVEILNILLDTAFIVEHVFVLVAVILDADLDALVQKSHLTESSGQCVVIIDDIIKNCRVRPECGL